VWSLSKGILLRNIVFPSIIDSITLDPGEHVFYAGGRDGKIHIAALGADSSSIKSHWLHIIGSLSSHRCVIFLKDPCHKCRQSSSMYCFVLRSFH
jgi:pre-rRNA-processing protein IPI3